MCIYIYISLARRMLDESPNDQVAFLRVNP